MRERGKPVRSEKSFIESMMEETAPAQERRWYSASVDEALSRLDSSRSGLSSDEARKRLERYGPNEPVREKPKGPLYYLLKQINQPLIYVLFVAAAVTAYLGEFVDVAVILAVVAANAAIGFIQESKAGREIEAMLKFTATSAKVRRDGFPRGIQAKEIVPGDIVMIQAGDMIPADIRLTVAKDLYVDESVFTGESSAVLKKTEGIEDEWLVPADRVNMGFSGTLVTRGRAEGAVVATGTRTNISRISLQLRETKKAAFPMMKRIEEMAKVISLAVASAAVFTFLMGFARDYEVIYMFRASVALAVAAIPEGLPALVTVVLASGVRSMAKMDAVIRNLPAVETLGSTTVICSDKTGTLTMNKMTVVRIHAGGKDYAVDPPDYRCIRHCEHPGPVLAMDEPELYDVLAAGMLCNDASSKDGEVHGDPTETALLLAADMANVRPSVERLGEIPFETTLGYMATLHHVVGGNVMFVKGSPESVVSKCTQVRVGERTAPIDRDAAFDKAREMAEDTLRVLAVAMKPFDKSTLEQKDVSGLTLLGLVGMLDPPRPEAEAAIKSCREAGIRVMMITGDHAATGAAIGKDLGLMKDRTRVVTGHEIEAMSGGEFARAVRESDIFARTTPGHKLKIVNQLVADGEIVAVTGDGVNDTPALKAANIGIAMGQSGTDAAKVAADMVLKDDNFATIVSAVEEGRNVYSTVQKVIAWTIPTNVGEAVLLLMAITLGIALPLMPLQILWINLVTAIALAVPLVFEPMDEGLLARPPRPPTERLITATLLRKFVIVSGLMVLGTFGVFYAYQDHGESVALSQTVALNTLVFFEMMYLLNGRSLTEPALSMSLRTNKWIPLGIAACFASQLLITYCGPLNRVFHTEGIGLLDWIVALVIASSVFFAIEVEKYVMRRRG